MPNLVDRYSTICVIATSDELDDIRFVVLISMLFALVFGWYGDLMTETPYVQNFDASSFASSTGPFDWESPNPLSKVLAAL